MRKAIQTCLLAAAVLGLATDARAQSASSLTGTVKDSSGGALPGTTVTVVNPTQAMTQTAQTGPQGIFVFAQLLPGTYSLKVELSGFKTVERSNVILPTKSAKAAELRHMVFWALTQGQASKYTAKLWFAPIPKVVLVASEKTLQQVQAST